MELAFYPHLSQDVLRAFFWSTKEYRDLRVGLDHIEEQLTALEYSELKQFIYWLESNKRTFGWNLPDVYLEYRRSFNVTE